MAAGHTIVDGDSVGGNDFRWQLFWKDKKSAESFWDKGPSDEFSAWADASRSVMVCDGVGRRDYAFELPGVQPDWGGASEFVSIFRACKYTENGGKNSLSSMYSKFNDFVAKENKDASWHVFLQEQNVVHLITQFISTMEKIQKHLWNTISSGLTT